MYGRKRTMESTKKTYKKRKFNAANSRVELYRRKPTGTILGRIGGKVSPTFTTMATSQGPFQAQKWVTFLYENGLTRMSGAASTSNANIVCNGAYDVDNNLAGTFGNKQPLYFDSLISASGPYKNYKVVSWETTYTVINNSTVPTNVYFLPSLQSTSDCDSVAECENFPGVQKRFLTSGLGGYDRCVVTVRGHIDDVHAGDNSLGLTGTQSANPTQSIFGGLLVATADGTTAHDCYVAISHKMYTLLTVVDALVS